MTAVITHSVSAGGVVDATADVDGAAWDAAHVITGLVGLAQGGTAADLSATGGSGQVLKQASAGAAVTVGTVAASEIASGAALTKTDDTNVTLTLGGTPTTALLAATSITVGWTGTLAAARLNSNVVQAITNDTNVTGSISAQNLTLGWTGTLAASRGGFGANISAQSGVPLFATGTATFTSTTGTGNFVRATSPTLVTPALGTPSAAVLTNATGLPLSTGVSGTLQAAQFPALTGDVTTSAGSLATAIGAGKVTSSMLNADVFSSTHTWSGVQTFSAAPIVPTQSPSDNSTKAASTAYVDAQVAGSVAGVASLNSKTGAISLSVVVQKFTSSGTYTPTTGMVYCIIECVGGGGGGGGVAGTSGDIFISGGGGSGGYSRLVASAATIGVSKTVTIGAGGAGGTAGANNGSAGGDTSVGVLCIGKGGSGGSGSSVSISNITGGAGGVAGTGGLTPAGSPGEAGFYAIGTNILVGSGSGGSSLFGGGSVCSAIVNATATAGVAAGAHGSGGSGANAVNTASTAAGGAGSAGVVVVTEYVIA